MDYYKFEFQTTAQNAEMLIALLGELPFDVFEETETGLDAFIPTEKCSDEIEQEVNQIKNLFEFSYQKIFIKYQNWNAVWESNFQPIIVRDFCGIRADFHEPIPNVQHEIVINPQMAFGTGHHETTWMMMDIMQSIDFTEKEVFDYGCGTGILAILASQLGAKKIDALDIELPSYENTLENSRINNIQNIQSIHGTLVKTKDFQYDVVLANINRHVILESFSTLNKMLPHQGTLLISGILTSDENLVLEAAKENGFQDEKINRKNNWICIQLKKNNT